MCYLAKRAKNENSPTKLIKHNRFADTANLSEQKK